MLHKNISVTIIVRNEASRIEACLQSLDGIADEIIVIDSFSTDNTVEICKKYGCKVSQRHFSGYGVQRQYATSLASHHYVLAIDADEVLSPALRASLLRLKQEGFTHRVYSFSRLNFYCGMPVRHCGWYPDVQIRLFNKRYANWDLRNVSEQVIFPDTLRPQLVDGDILHYRCTTPEEYSKTERRHAAIRGKVLAAKCDKIGIMTPKIKGFFAFIKCFIAKKGIFDGEQGWTISCEQFRNTVHAYQIARHLLNPKVQ